MATFDQLSADQRAIIELVLQRGQSYSDLADTLGMPAARVRTLAREALGELAPATARDVETDWRDQIADYLLNQQSGPEATATRGHLRRSEPARAWARSLLDSLDELYGENPPTIPEGGRGGRPKRERAPKDGEGRKPLSAAGGSTLRRRRLLGAAAGIAALLFILLVPVSLIAGKGLAFAGGDDGDKNADQASNAAPKPIGQIVLRGVDGAKAEGRAVIAERDGRRFLIVQAQLPENKSNREVYEVWLYNSQNDAMSVGAQRTDAQGNFAGAGPLPKDASKFRFIDISTEAVDRNQKHSGKSVLRGRLDQIRPLPQNAGQQGAAPQGAAPQGGQGTPAPAPQSP